MYENPAMSSLFELGAHVGFLGTRTGKLKKESPLLGIEQGPIRGANNVCFVVILPERWDILDQNSRDGYWTTEPVRVNACDESIAHCCGFGQSCSPLSFLGLGSRGLSGECSRHNHAIDRGKENNGQSAG